MSILKKNLESDILTCKCFKKLERILPELIYHVFLFRWAGTPLKHTSDSNLDSLSAVVQSDSK